MRINIENLVLDVKNYNEAQEVYDKNPNEANWEDVLRKLTRLKSRLQSLSLIKPDRKH